MAHIEPIKETQTEILRKHFMVRPSISGVEAAAMYRIRSLARRINDLEAKGFQFRREFKKDPTGQRYVRYHFVGVKQDAAV